MLHLDKSSALLQTCGNDKTISVDIQPLDWDGRGQDGASPPHEVHTHLANTPCVRLFPASIC